MPARPPVPHPRHHPGWALVAAGLVLTALTPKFDGGAWKELGRSLSEPKLSPYNLFLVFGIVALLYVAYAAKSRAAALRVTVVLLVETALHGLLKLLTWNVLHIFPRPSGSSAGFPSGHTAAVCALAYLLTERWPKGWPLWYGAAALVGWARWAGGAHYPYQVVGGAVLGLACAVVFAHRFEDKPTPAGPTIEMPEPEIDRNPV